MEQFNIFLNFFVIIYVFIAAPNEADGYKILNSDEALPAYYPWSLLGHREILRNQKKDAVVGPRNTHTEELPNGTKRMSQNDEQMPELHGFGKSSGIKESYDGLPVPMILWSPYPNSKN